MARIVTILVWVTAALATGASTLSAYQQIEFVREIGDPSAKPPQRQFSGPRSLALGAERIYVVDQQAQRIVATDLSGKTLFAWGKRGEQPGQFKSPSGIALDDKGRVYVSDGDSGRIQVFDGEGKYLYGFGSKGSGPRQFSEPGGIAAAGGLLYVADKGNSRVQVLSADGIYLREIVVADKLTPLKSPVDVAVDAMKRLFVLDEASGRIFRFEGNGAQSAVLGGRGKGTEGFSEPGGIDVDGRGNIYVADRGNGKLKKLDGEGKLLASFGSEGGAPGQFRSAAGIAVDGQDRVYVADPVKGTVQVFSLEPDAAKVLVPASPPPSVAYLKELAGEYGALAVNKRIWGISGDSLSAVGVISGRKIGSRGKDPAMLKEPQGMAVDGAGNFWVADTGNDRLQKFSIEGSLLHVIGKPGSGEGEFRAPAAVAVSAKGNICVADTGNRRVQVFSPKGVFLGMFGKAGSQKGQFDEPADLAVDAFENIYVVDRGGNKIAKFDAAGALLWEAGKKGRGDGELAAPTNIVVSPDNEVYVLDGGNSRVQVFSADGKFLRKFGSEGKGPGEFRSPAGLALDEGVRLVVGDRGNKRVQVFTLKLTPATPADLATQARMNEIQLNWKPNTESHLEQYAVYRSDAPAGPYAFLAATADSFYLDRGLPSNRAYHYRVAARAREGNESAPSAVVSAVTPRLVPSAPKKVRIEAAEKQITLSWLPNLEPFVSHYQVYRTRQLSSGFEPTARAERPIHTDAQLADESLYYYQITAVGKEGDESPASEVVFAATPKASLTAPPIEITKIALGEIFASAYKYYEANALGTVTLRNNTDMPFPAAKLSFSIKGFMDFPTEAAVPEIAARGEAQVSLKPVFSNKILEVTENTPLQSELALTYYAAGEAKTVARTFPVTLYERHAMTWDQAEKIGAFVTPKDPPVADFARGIVQQYVDAYPNLHQSVVYARALYAALGVAGLAYIVDPTSPFAEFSEKRAAVDYLQYPRDTLSRRSGDCDDLSVLYAGALENIGIGAALVDVPGHVFVLFNTGVPEADRQSLGFPAERLVLHRNTVWIPVEMTMVGQSFTRAWQKGAETYRDWAAKGKAEIVEIQKAWERFRPVTLPAADGKVAVVKREDADRKFPGELDALGRERLANLSAEYLAQLKKNGQDAQALAQLGILYGENNLYAESLEQFQKVLAIDKNNAAALNNIGNLYFLQERTGDALQAYESALKAAPQDAGIMVNLSRALLKAGKKDEAKKTLQAAAEIDPRVLRQSADLAADLGLGK